MFSLFNKNEDASGEEFSGEIEVDVQEERQETQEIGQIALDILDMEDEMMIVAPLAGMPIDDVHIAIAQNVLTISGERTRPDFYDEVEKVLVNECFFGAFSRSVILPENLAFNKIRALMENNLLVIEIPKLQFPSRTIKINKLENTL